MKSVTRRNILLSAAAFVAAPRIAGAADIVRFGVLYPNLTTVQGNRFRFRGGDPTKMGDNLLKLFQKHLGGSLRSVVERGGASRKAANGQTRPPVVH